MCKYSLGHYIKSNKLTIRKESARKSHSFTEEGDGEGDGKGEREGGDLLPSITLRGF